MTAIKQILLGGQFLMTAFGALVLVPLLTGFDPSLALLGTGLGTLAFQLVTKRQVPLFLGPSFAFIPAMIFSVKTWSLEATLGGLIVAGIFYLGLGLLVYWKGQSLLKKVLPPIVTAPIIMLIGMVLLPVALNMAMGKTGDGGSVIMPISSALPISILALVATAICCYFGKGFVRLSCLAIGILVGQVLAFWMGTVDLSPIAQAEILVAPQFVTPVFRWDVILYILPFALAPAIEHFGDILAVSEVCQKDFLQSPGVHRTLMGDGVATVVSSMIGGPPNTTYSEVTGAVALTRATDPKIMVYASLWAIACSFLGVASAVLQTISPVVMGGVLLLLFGNIVFLGLQILKKNAVNFLELRTLSIVGAMLVCGLSMMEIQLGLLHLKGVGLAAVVGIGLNGTFSLLNNIHKVTS